MNKDNSIPDYRLVQPDTINQKIVKWRKFHSFTQADMAERLGMKTSAYSRMERKGNITVSMLFKICEILNAEPRDFLRYEKPRNVKNENDIRLTNLEMNMIKLFRTLSKRDRDEFFKCFLEILIRRSKRK